MKVVFMGTPDFAVPCLLALLEEGHEVVMAVTQPDKPKGRSQTLTPPPVKVVAIEKGIPVYQPVSMKTEECADVLQNAGADVFIVVAFGKILPQNILDIPKYGSINIHASLLPKLRGAAPIQWSIANGEKITGVTSMQMNAGLDTGDMLIKKNVEIEDDETGETLHDKLSMLGALVLKETLNKLSCGELTKTVQDDSLSSYAPMITKENTKIDFAKTAQDVHNLVRAMNPFPGAYCYFGDKKLKLLRTEIADSKKGECGEIVEIAKDYFCIKCKDVAVKVLELQLEGKKRMMSRDFLLGNKFFGGVILK